MKLVAKTAKTAKVRFTHAAVGSKGIGSVFGRVDKLGEDLHIAWAQTKGSGYSTTELVNFHVRGEQMPPQFACYDMQCHVAAAGGSIRHYPIAELAKVPGVRSGLVKFSDSPNGEYEMAYTFGSEGYWCVPTRKAGRVETFGRCSDGRNVGLRASVVDDSKAKVLVPLKGAKIAPKPVSAPAKPAGKPAAKPSKKPGKK